jgi:hypothetical protein
MPQNDLTDKRIQVIKQNQTPDQTTSTHHQKPLYSIMIVSAITALCLVLPLLFINNLFSKTPPPGPWTEIAFPLHRKTTGANVKITTETKNVDKKRLGGLSKPPAHGGWLGGLSENGKYLGDKLK